MSEKLTSADFGEPLAIGIDIGGTAIKAAIVGVRGDLLESFHEPSPRTACALHDFVHSVLKCAKRPVRGIGIGCKGIIDAASSRVKSSPGDLHFLEGRLLSEIISAGDTPVCAENDARTALIAEVLWGAARGRRNVVMLTLGTGVGGAVLVDAAHMHRAAPATLSMGSSGHPPDTGAIFRAAAGGDECARYVVDRALEYLGAALVSILHTFDPEILILGGNIAAAGPQLIAPIQDKIARRTKTLLGREVPIVFQKTIGYGGVAGAAGLVFLEQRLLTI